MLYSIELSLVIIAKINTRTLPSEKLINTFLLDNLFNGYKDLGYSSRESSIYNKLLT